MKRRLVGRSLGVTAVVAALMVTLTSALGAPRTEKNRTVLEGVAGLERLVTYTETKIPLGDLVLRVANETGVALVAAKDVADEPVAVAVQVFPARELLRQLADLLDYKWRAVAAGGDTRYEIWQDVASRNREEALRRALTGDVERRFQEAVRQVVEMASLPQTEIDALIAQDEERGKQLSELPAAQRQALESNPETRALRERAARAEQLWSPANRALAKMIGRLTPEQSKLLWDGDPVTFSSRPGPGDLPLPAETLRALRDSSFQLHRPRELDIRPEDAEAVAQQEQQSADQWSRASGFQVMAWLDTENPLAELRLFVNAYPLQDDSLAQEFWGGEMGRVRIETGSWAAKQEQQAEERTPERAKALSEDPVLGARKLFAMPRPARPQRQWRSLQEYLPHVARVYGVPVLSDAYGGSMMPPPLSETETTPLFELMDHLTGVHHRWEWSEGMLRLRNRTWFLHRRTELPLRIFRRWQESCKEYGALRWEDLLEPHGRQAGAGENEYKSEAGLPMDFGGIHARFALSLYETLSPAQRRQLERGQPLRMAQMTPAQQVLFLRPLRQGDCYSISVGLPPHPKPNPALANLSLKNQTLLRTRDVYKGVVRYRDQPAPVSGLKPEAPDAVDPTVRRYLVSRYTFDFHYGAGTRRPETLTVAMPARDERKR